MRKIWFDPVSVDVGGIVLLFLASSAVSAFNAGVGPSGGGLIGVVSLIVPPPMSIVLHAITSAFSSGLRAASLRQHIDRRMLLSFVLGSLPAVVLAAWLTEFLPQWLWLVAIGVFVIVSTSLTPARAVFRRLRSLVLTGFVSTFLSYYTGTGGVIAAPVILERSGSRQEAIATQAACIGVQHLMKVTALVAAIVISRPFLVLLASLLVGATVGNALGIRFLQGLTDERHRRLQRAILIVIGLALISQGVNHAFA